MLRLTAIALGGLVVGLAAIGLIFFTGMRRASPTVRRLVRRFNRTIVNPRVLRTAGTQGATASVIHHTGRSTGSQYETPVDARPSGDGFVIALPYGTSANWVRNVLARGSATIVHDGAAVPVDRPQVVPLAEVAASFSEKDRRNLDRFRVDRCLRLRNADADTTQRA